MSYFHWLGVTSTAYATGSNFSPSGPPATSGDTLIHDQSAVGALAGSNQNATTLVQWLIKHSNTYAIGDNGTPFKINSPITRIGDASPGADQSGGSGRVNIDGSTTATKIVVVQTSNSPTDAGKEPVRIKAVNAANLLVVQSGRVGVATDSYGDVATFSEIAVTGEALVNIGSGTTLATLLQSAGTVSMGCAAAVVKQTGGTLTATGSGGITTSATIGGTAILSSTGTIALLSILDGGTADFSGDVQAKTVTLLQMYKGSTLITGSHVTITTLQLVECDLSDVTIQTGGGNLGLAVTYL